MHNIIKRIQDIIEFSVWFYSTPQDKGATVEIEETK